MPDQAKVTSIEALEMFRASLIIFLTKARTSLDQVSDEVNRTRNYVQQDRRMFWEGEARRRKRDLDQAEAELFGSRISVLQRSSAQQQAAVHKARRALAEAEEKLGRVKVWTRNFETQTGHLVKGMDGFRHVLDQTMPKAIAYLVQAQTTLESYAESAPPASAPRQDLGSGDAGPAQQE